MKDVKMSPGMKEMHENISRVLGIQPDHSIMRGLFPIADKTGKEPCGECHLQPGETCDICNAHQPE